MTLCQGKWESRANARSDSIKFCRKFEQDRNQETFNVGNLEVTSEFKRATYITPQTRNGFVTDQRSGNGDSRGYRAQSWQNVPWGHVHRAAPRKS